MRARRPRPGQPDALLAAAQQAQQSIAWLRRRAGSSGSSSQRAATMSTGRHVQLRRRRTKLSFGESEIPDGGYPSGRGLTCDVSRGLGELGVGPVLCCRRARRSWPGGHAPGVGIRGHAVRSAAVMAVHACGNRAADRGSTD